MREKLRQTDDVTVGAIVALLRPVWRPLVRAFAADVAAELAEKKVDHELDQRSPALIELRCTPRMYLEAARREPPEFPSSRRGRRVVARRRDVEAWLERKSASTNRRRERANESPMAEPSIQEEARAAIGLPPKALRALPGGRSR
jgi:hypothetical protein